MFFIPYAGGSSLSYQACYNYLSEEVEPVSIELAGRGKRYQEPLYNDLDEAICDVSKAIESEINGEDYLIFGHSMGAVIAYEAYYKIKEKGLQMPKALVLSGRPTPNIIRNRINVREYDDEAFVKLISFYGGLPKDFERPEVRELFLPIMKSDFTILDEYEYIDKEEKIKSNLVVLCGKRDFSAPEREVEKWVDFAGADFSLYTFPEGHFFINDHFEEIAKIITEQFE